MNFTLILSLSLIVGLGYGQETEVTSESSGQVDHSLRNHGDQVSPLRIGVVGLVHTHVHWILGREPKGDIEIVGIVESNRDLAQRYCRQHDIPTDIVFDSIEQMVQAKKPEAVAAFNTIKDHLGVVEYCAPRQIHVMVEKPLARDLSHAKKMVELARKHKIHLLTNYETSWYPSVHAAKRLCSKSRGLANFRKMNFYTGHRGPIEIGCNPEFVEWLTDPEFNGGGALNDFGCYGANLATWLLNGQEPVSVTCVTRQTKPDRYPKVEDDATIIVNYPNTQVVIQASWDWSHNRKEMELFGANSYVICKNANELITLLDDSQEEKRQLVSHEDDVPADPFNLFQRVVKKGYALADYDVSSLENNFRVMQILEAAKISAMRNKTVEWREIKNR